MNHPSRSSEDMPFDLSQDAIPIIFASSQELMDEIQAALRGQ
jgi:hypothetical protein